MVIKQGYIVKLDFNPQSGHEQAGYRPAVVVSNNFFNEKTNMVIVCPITNTKNKFPLHIELDDRTETTGTILCEHVKALDITHRNCVFIERLPDEILDNVLNVIFSEIER